MVPDLDFVIDASQLKEIVDKVKLFTAKSASVTMNVADIAFIVEQGELTIRAANYEAYVSYPVVAILTGKTGFSLDPVTFSKWLAERDGSISFKVIDHPVKVHKQFWIKEDKEFDHFVPGSRSDEREEIIIEKRLQCKNERSTVKFVIRNLEDFPKPPDRMLTEKPRASFTILAVQLRDLLEFIIPFAAIEKDSRHRCVYIKRDKKMAAAFCTDGTKLALAELKPLKENNADVEWSWSFDLSIMSKFPPLFKENNWIIVTLFDRGIRITGDKGMKNNLLFFCAGMDGSAPDIYDIVYAPLDDYTKMVCLTTSFIKSLKRCKTINLNNDAPVYFLTHGGKPAVGVCHSERGASASIVWLYEKESVIPEFDFMFNGINMLKYIQTCGTDRFDMYVRGANKPIYFPHPMPGWKFVMMPLVSDNPIPDELEKVYKEIISGPDN